MITLKLKAASIPGFAVLRDRHLSTVAMHIKGNDLQGLLLSMVSNQRSQRATRRLRIRASSAAEQAEWTTRLQLELAEYEVFRPSRHSRSQRPNPGGSILTHIEAFKASG